MLLGWFRENKGKSLLIAGIVLVWAIFGILLTQYGYYKTWRAWGVPPMKFVFMDFQLIPGSAESFRHGFEPTIKNPYDPTKRIFNYPTFWRLFFYTGITMDDTAWFVGLMLVLYFWGVIEFSKKISIVDALLMLLVIFSPASMLLYERGNVDLIIFFICAITVLATDYSTNLTAVLIAIGAVVKMFPLFGVTVLLKETKQRFYKLFLIVVAFMVLYGLKTFQSQSVAWNTTMRGDGTSYGSFVLITRLGDYLTTQFPNLFTDGQWQIFFEVLALVLILAAGVIAIREPHVLHTSHERNLSAFRMGASIYIGTFLLGNNWDYRLAFLIFVVPQLSQWLLTGNKKYRYFAVGVMIVTLLTCWGALLQFDLPFVPLKDRVNRVFVVDEFFNWLLVPGFTYLLVASFPQWLKTDLQKVFGSRQ